MDSSGRAGTCTLARRMVARRQGSPRSTHVVSDRLFTHDCADIRVTKRFDQRRMRSVGGADADDIGIYLLQRG